MSEQLLRDLAELDPVDETRVPDGHSPEADRLLAWVVAQPHAEQPRRSGRRRWLLVPAALLLLGAGWLLAQPSERPHAIGCYREASVAADRHEVRIDIAEEPPAAACARLWEAGELWDDPVPQSLASCVTETSSIAVIPGSGEAACEALMWAPLDWDASAHEIALLDAEVHRFHMVRSCPGEDETREHAGELLDEHGLEDWDVVLAAPTTPAEPCASISIDTDERRLLLVPLPDLSDP